MISINPYIIDNCDDSIPTNGQGQSFNQKNAVSESIIAIEQDLKLRLKKTHICKRRQESNIIGIINTTKLEILNSTSAFFEPKEMTKIKPNILFSKKFIFNSNEQSNTTFNLNPSNPNKINNYILEVIPMDINAKFIPSLLPKPTHQQRYLVSTTKLYMKNLNFYCVLGFQYFEDCDNNDFVDLDLHVAGDWIINSQQSNETLQAYLRDNNISAFAIKNVALTCVFIDTNTNSLSAEGCKSFFSADLSQVSCRCNHATVFTIVLSVSVKTVPYAVQV